MNPFTSMSTCTRCGASFGCAMADGGTGPCWCTALPPVVALPSLDAGAPAPGCWCPTCLEQHIAQSHAVAPATTPPG
ncbi:cysteine-rich CWC family protein [Herbaspirillum sp. SJZ107]|uniref:cysteine-rich CWC family protein n=1 Tax=Herbaspirillum sp. SJZ107 TaxID=2572881 RepID=UPI0011704CDF|nr:cysteine-rich CWC protein [Herbaspirillum sp. SJZ107]